MDIITLSKPNTHPLRTPRLPSRHRPPLRTFPPCRYLHLYSLMALALPLDCGSPMPSEDPLPIPKPLDTQDTQMGETDLASW